MHGRSFSSVVGKRLDVSCEQAPGEEETIRERSEPTIAKGNLTSEASRGWGGGEPLIFGLDMPIRPLVIIL